MSSSDRHEGSARQIVDGGDYKDADTTAAAGACHKKEDESHGHCDWPWQTNFNEQFHAVHVWQESKHLFDFHHKHGTLDSHQEYSWNATNVCLSRGSRLAAGQAYICGTKCCVAHDWAVQNVKHEASADDKCRLDRKYCLEGNDGEQQYSSYMVEY